MVLTSFVLVVSLFTWYCIFYLGIINGLNLHLYLWYSSSLGMISFSWYNQWFESLFVSVVFLFTWYPFLVSSMVFIFIGIIIFNCTHLGIIIGISVVSSMVFILVLLLVYLQWYIQWYSSSLASSFLIVFILVLLLVYLQWYLQWCHLYQWYLFFQIVSYLVFNGIGIILVLVLSISVLSFQSMVLV